MSSMADTLPVCSASYPPCIVVARHCREYAEVHVVWACCVFADMSCHDTVHSDVKPLATGLHLQLCKTQPVQFSAKCTLKVAPRPPMPNQTAHSVEKTCHILPGPATDTSSENSGMHSVASATGASTHCISTLLCLNSLDTQD